MNIREESEKIIKNADNGPECYEMIISLVTRAVDEALDDIANFHDKGLEEIEKRTGFLGWTCCGQKKAIAEKALETYKCLMGEGNEGEK